MDELKKYIAKKLEEITEEMEDMSETYKKQNGDIMSAEFCKSLVERYERKRTQRLVYWDLQNKIRKIEGSKEN